MKSLEFLQRNLRFLGILPREGAKYVASIGISHGIWISNICATLWFRLYWARTPAEQSESYFVALTLLSAVFWHMTLHFRNKEYAKLLEDLDIIIGKSDENF